MTGLSREAILAKIEERKREVEPYPVPEWDGEVYMRRLTLEAIRSTGYWDNAADINSVIIGLLVATLADEEGNPLLTMEDAAALMESEVEVAMGLFSAAAKKHGLSNDKLEEAMRTFGGAQDDGTSSR